MDFVIDDLMIQEFQLESNELLDDAEDSLLAIDTGGDFMENFHKIFRAFHSIKGGSAIFGMEDLTKHMHVLEGLFESRREKSFSKAQIDYFLLGVDTSRVLLERESVNFEYLSQEDFDDFAPEFENEIHDEAVSSNPHVEEKEKEREENHDKTKRINKKPLIFIVEDEAEQAQTLSEILEEKYETQCFEDGKQALDNIEIFPPDVIITDMKMPNMNGIEMLKEIRKIDPHVPIIFISAFLDKKIILEALNYGAFNFLEKPYYPNIVTNVVSMAVERKAIFRLMEKSTNLMVYQFNNYLEYLKADEKIETMEMVKENLVQIMDQRRVLTQGNLATYQAFEENLNEEEKE